MGYQDIGIIASALALLKARETHPLFLFPNNVLKQIQYDLEFLDEYLVIMPHTISILMGQMGQSRRPAHLILGSAPAQKLSVNLSTNVASIVFIIARILSDRPVIKKLEFPNPINTAIARSPVLSLSTTLVSER